MDLAAYKQKKQIDFEYTALQKQLEGSGAPSIDGLFHITEPVEVNTKMKEIISNEKTLTTLEQALIDEVKKGNASVMLDAQESAARKQSKTKGEGFGEVREVPYLVKNSLKSALDKAGIITKGKTVNQLLDEVNARQEGLNKNKTKMLVLGKNYSPINPEGVSSFVSNALNVEGAIREMDGKDMKKKSVLSGSDDAKNLSTGKVYINFLDDVPITILKGDKKDIRKYGVDLSKIDAVLDTHVKNISDRFKALYNNLDHPKVNLTAEELLKVTNPNVDWDFNNYPGRKQILQEFVKLQSDRDMVLTELQNFGLGESKQTKY